MWRPTNARLDWLTARPIAHRGLHDKTVGCEENSLAAFAAATTQGFAIECDLQLSADGEAMVFHDDTLDRLTAETGGINLEAGSEVVTLHKLRDRLRSPAERSQD